MKEKLKFGVSLSSSDSDIDDGSTNEENSVCVHCWLLHELMAM